MRGNHLGAEGGGAIFCTRNLKLGKANGDEGENEEEKKHHGWEVGEWRG